MGKEGKMDKDMNDLKDKEAGEKDRDPGGLNKKQKLKALNPMIFLVVIILPVSYTHLDVSKRQM